MKPYPTEREVKFLVNRTMDLRTLPVHLLQLDCRTSEPTRHQFHEIYLDTRDRWFLRAGLGLRLRTLGNRYWITLKSGQLNPNWVSYRVELETEMNGTPPRFPGVLPAGTISRWIRSVHPGTQRLERLIALSHQRDEYDVTTPEGTRIKACADLLRSDSGRFGLFREIELELKDGNPSGLETLALRLQKQTGWCLSTEPKLNRALRLDPACSAEREILDGNLRKRLESILSDSKSLEETIERTIRTQWDLIRLDEPGTRAGLDPERIHQMRLSVRRLRTALTLYSSWLPGRASTKPMLHQLATLSHVLGCIRDTDICLKLLIRYLEKPQTSSSAYVLQALLFQRRRRQHRGLLRYLESEDFRALDHWARRLTPEISKSRKTDSQLARDLLAKQTKRLHRTIQIAQSYFSMKSLHKLRIRFKKIRFARESLSPIVGNPTQRDADKIARIQNILGEVQDEATLLKNLKAFRIRMTVHNEMDTDGILESLKSLLAAQTDRYSKRSRKIRKILPALQDSKIIRTYFRF